MASIIENGGGVRGANNYQHRDAVTAYLTARGRETENGWDALSADAQDAACIAATDYIDRRHGPRLLGRRQFTFEGAAASGTVTLSATPGDGDTVTVGAVILTFRVAPAPAVITEVLIGADAPESAANLQATIASAVSGFTASVVGAVVTVTSDAEGGNGNYLTLDAIGANLAAVAFSGGLDGGDQPREFPRTGLRRRDGSLVAGLPPELLHAHSEYSVRAAAGVLEADPTVPSAGQGPITKIRERVEGAVDTTTEYASPSESSSSGIQEPYPAADQLLADFLRGASVFGRVGRA